MEHKRFHYGASFREAYRFLVLKNKLFSKVFLLKDTSENKEFVHSNMKTWIFKDYFKHNLVKEKLTVLVAL